jgi:hypothetical protein
MNFPLSFCFVRSVQSDDVKEDLITVSQSASHHACVWLDGWSESLLALLQEEEECCARVIDNEIIFVCEFETSFTGWVHQD